MVRIDLDARTTIADVVVAISNTVREQQQQPQPQQQQQARVAEMQALVQQEQNTQSFGHRDIAQPPDHPCHPSALTDPLRRGAYCTTCGGRRSKSSIRTAIRHADWLGGPPLKLFLAGNVFAKAFTSLRAEGLHLSAHRSTGDAGGAGGSNARAAMFGFPPPSRRSLGLVPAVDGAGNGKQERTGTCGEPCSEPMGGERATNGYESTSGFQALQSMDVCSVDGSVGASMCACVRSLDTTTTTSDTGGAVGVAQVERVGGGGGEGGRGDGRGAASRNKGIHAGGEGDTGSGGAEGRSGGAEGRSGGAEGQHLHANDEWQHTFQGCVAGYLSTTDMTRMQPPIHVPLLASLGGDKAAYDLNETKGGQGSKGGKGGKGGLRGAPDGRHGTSNGTSAT